MAHVLKRVLVAVAPCLLVLSGCGVAGTDFNPGVGARVGDETISTNTIDELTADYCDAVRAEVDPASPLSNFRVGLAALLTWRAAVDQLAEGYDIAPSQEYRDQVAGFARDADQKGYTGRDREVYVEVQGLQAYIFDTLAQIGATELEAEGEADPTVDFQYARGNDELVAWIDRNGVEFDPRYGLEMVDGEPVAIDTDLSVVAGDLAKSASEFDPTTGAADAGYVAALPASATCG